MASTLRKKQRFLAAVLERASFPQTCLNIQPNSSQEKGNTHFTSLSAPLVVWIYQPALEYLALAVLRARWPGSVWTVGRILSKRCTASPSRCQLPIGGLEPNRWFGGVPGVVSHLSNKGHWLNPNPKHQLRVAGFVLKEFPGKQV